MSRGAEPDPALTDLQGAIKCFRAILEQATDQPHPARIRAAAKQGIEQTWRALVRVDELNRTPTSGGHMPSREVVKLIEALNNALATLETLMAHYGDQMSAEDRAGRKQVIAEGHEAIANVPTRCQ